MKFPWQKSPSGFSASSTAEDVTQGIDATGLTAIVTGASSGIGAETARVLALRGVHVIMAIRNLDAGRKVKETILKDIPNVKIDIMELDVSSLESVSKFAAKFESLSLPLNILINNAGIMGIPFALSVDGIEMQFATNHLGHFFLTNLLLDNMKNTARDSNREGKIINVSSLYHRLAFKGISFDKLSDRSSYCSYTAYGQSKLANILHANELTRRLKVFIGWSLLYYLQCWILDMWPKTKLWERDINPKVVKQKRPKEEGVNVSANSLHPGGVDTKIVRHQKLLDSVLQRVGKHLLKNVAQGASTQCYVALNPQVEGISGNYFSDNNIVKPSSFATNVDLGKKLWAFSLNLTDNHLTG